MSDVDRMVAFVRAAMDEAEQIARAACLDDPMMTAWTAKPSQGATYPFVVVDGYDDGVVQVYAENADHEDTACYVAHNDPAAALRRIAAERQLVADLLADGHATSEEDVWFACASLKDEDGDPVCPDATRAPGPCDCGRDARVERRLRLLAEGWGWTEETSPHDASA